MQGKSVLVTGGTGSFGRVFVRKLLEEHGPKKVIVFSRDEWKQWEMRQTLDDPRLRYIIGDVRDRERLRRAFSGVDVVIHAAALKQVPTAEYNPSEFVRTNVEGAMNVIDAAIDCAVKTVIGLSTDKAVNPINLYGATKLCADKLFVAGNADVGERGHPKFAVVRYGNVLASRGSVIHRWQEMVRQGASTLPITDERMTRFWLSVEEAADFVIQTVPRVQGGEIFVPKISSMKLMDLAQAVAPNLGIEVIGLREGEKLHEQLISSEDAHHTYEERGCYVIAPELMPFSTVGDLVPSGFSYRSDSNQNWLTPRRLQEILQG